MARQSDAVARLRADWGRRWVRESSRPARRAAMLDIHVVLHAASLLLAPRVPSGDLAEVLLVHEELGRAAARELVGEIALTAHIVNGIVPSPDPVGCLLPVMAGMHDQPLRVERSRPGWHLDGTVRGAPWSADVERLAVFAVDEGGNDVLTILAPDVARLEIAPSSAPRNAPPTVDIHFDDVPLSGVAHCPGEPAKLADQLMLLAMADALGAAGWLLERSRADTELQLCRSALWAAAASSTSMSVVRRQHDVSAAALLVLPTCLRIAVEAPARDPETLRRVQRIHALVGTLPAWHRDRLTALV